MANTNKKGALILTVFLGVCVVAAIVSLVIIKTMGTRPETEEERIQKLYNHATRSSIKKMMEYPFLNTEDVVKNSSVGETTLLLAKSRYAYMKTMGTDIEILSVSLKNQQKTTFVPGENMPFEAIIENPEDFPLVEMQLYAKIARRDENNDQRQKNGNYAVDHLVVAKDINVAANSKNKLELALNIPQGVISGAYVIEFYLVQNERFFLSGDPFFPNVNKRYSLDISVTGDSPQGVYLDKNDIKIEGVKCELRRRFATITGKNVPVEFFLVNDSDADKTVLLSYDVLSYRGEFINHLMDGDYSPAAAEEVIVPARSRKSITHFITSDGKYFNILQIESLCEGQKSLLHIPYYNQTEYYIGEFSGPQVSVFPIKKGRSFEVFSGFRYKSGLNRIEEGEEKLQFDLSSIKTEGSVEIKLYDNENNELGGMLMDGYLTGWGRAWKNTIKAPHNLNYLKMVGKIYAPNGMVSDEFERVYDCKLLGEGFCL